MLPNSSWHKDIVERYKMIALRYHYQHCVSLLPLLFFLLLLLAWKVLLKKVFLEAPTIITTFFICRVFLSYENNYIVGTFIEVGHKMIFNKDYIFIVIQAYNIKCKSKYLPFMGKIYFVLYWKVIYIFVFGKSMYPKYRYCSTNFI